MFTDMFAECCLLHLAPSLPIYFLLYGLLSLMPPLAGDAKRQHERLGSFARHLAEVFTECVACTKKAVKEDGETITDKEAS